MTDALVPQDFRRRMSFCAVVPIDAGQSAQQTAQSVLVVTPRFFASNPDTAVDNRFMDATPEVMARAREIAEKAVDQHRAFVDSLRAAGVEVVVVEAKDEDAPDACFPNNWFTTHPEAEVGARALVLYPMAAMSRRRERRGSIVDRLRERYPRLVDISHNEQRADSPFYLEGTGVLVLDRAHRVAYAALSQRCDEWLAQQWADAFRFDLVAFHTRMSADDGSPIYHTNVMLSVGSRLAVVCLEVVATDEERERLRDSLAQHHAVVEISRAQMASFCANVLEVRNTDGGSVLVMSTTAYNAFTAEQRALLLENVDQIVHSDVSVIETVGGGGVRCMMAELF